ncbi:MAG: winged helix-turn-helix domain-containing protein [Acidimicrobiales bacterium]
MPRMTSTLAYRDIKNSGKRDTQVGQILNCLEDQELSTDLTLKEISRLTGLEINAVSGRVNGMKKDGLVSEAPKRQCRVTGRWVTPVERR